MTPNVNDGLWGMCQCRFIDFNTWTLWRGMLIMKEAAGGEAGGGRGPGLIWEISVSSAAFAVNLKPL